MINEWWKLRHQWMDQVHGLPTADVIATVCRILQIIPAPLGMVSCLMAPDGGVVTVPVMALALVEEVEIRRAVVIGVCREVRPLPMMYNEQALGDYDLDQQPPAGWLGFAESESEGKALYTGKAQELRSQSPR